MNYNFTALCSGVIKNWKINKNMDKFSTVENGLKIQLEELSEINIFVGKNGSGKSRLFSAIKESKAHNIALIDLNEESREVDLELVYTTAQDLISNTPHGIIYFNWIFDIFFNDLEEELESGISPILYKVTRKNTSKQVSKILWKNEKLIFIFTDDTDETINLSFGFYKLFRLNYFIQNEIIRCKVNRIREILIICDEIENGFHPDYIKKLSTYFSWLIERSKAIDSDRNIQFFISTHSPILVSAFAKEKKHQHKVYLLENGTTREIRNKHKVNTETANLGFSGEEALQAANQMLGLEINDITNEYFVLAEESIQTLLNYYAKKHNLEKRFFTYTTSGDSNTIEKALSLLSIYDVLPSCQIDVKVIFDGKLESINEDKKNLLKKKISEKNFLFVKDESVLDLETCYDASIVKKFLTNKEIFDSWDKETDSTFKKYLNKIKITDSKCQGTMKAELAEFVVDNCSKDELKKKLPFLDSFFPS